MTDHFKVNKPAPLKNVAAFAALLEKMVERDADLPGLACFYGPSGWGKTKSAVYGAKIYRATYIECGYLTTARSMITSILIELGLPKPRGTATDMAAQAIEIMAGDIRRPLIVDEAHFVASKRFVDILRELADKSGAPVIMIGEEMLPAALAQFERVHNRVLEWLPAQPCDAEDLQLLVANRGKGISLSPDLAGAILKATNGNTRRIAANIVRAIEVSQRTGRMTVELNEFGGAGAIIAQQSFTPRRF